MSKVQLSAKEYELVTDAEWFLTKQSIIGKVYLLFGGISIETRNIAAACVLDEKIISHHPKISRGENYLGLPYVIMDYPRIFGREDIIAIRIMFWWAHYFSITLHLKGSYHSSFAAHYKNNVATLSLDNFFICTGNNEWDHRVDEENYVSASLLSNTALLDLVNNKPFLKIAVKIPLTEWDNAELEILKFYREIMNLLGR